MAIWYQSLFEPPTAWIHGNQDLGANLSAYRVRDSDTRPIRTGFWLGSLGSTGTPPVNQNSHILRNGQLVKVCLRPAWIDTRPVPWEGGPVTPGQENWLFGWEVWATPLQSQYWHTAWANQNSHILRNGHLVSKFV